MGVIHASGQDERDWTGECGGQGKADRRAGIVQVFRVDRPVDKVDMVKQTVLKKPTLDHNNLTNYRLVLNISFLSKAIQKIVLWQLFAYLELP